MRGQKNFSEKAPNYLQEQKIWYIFAPPLKKEAEK